MLPCLQKVSFAEDLVQESLYTPAASTDSSIISEAKEEWSAGDEETGGNSPDPGDGDVTPTNASPQVWTKTASVSDDNDDNDDDLEALFAAAEQESGASANANAILEELLDAGELESIASVSQPHRADARTSVAEVVTEQVGSAKPTLLLTAACRPLSLIIS